MQVGDRAVEVNGQASVPDALHAGCRIREAMRWPRPGRAAGLRGVPDDDAVDMAWPREGCRTSGAHGEPGRRPCGARRPALIDLLIGGGQQPTLSVAVNLDRRRSAALTPGIPTVSSRSEGGRKYRRWITQFRAPAANGRRPESVRYVSWPCYARPDMPGAAGSSHATSAFPRRGPKEYRPRPRCKRGRRAALFRM